MEGLSPPLSAFLIGRGASRALRRTSFGKPTAQAVMFAYVIPRQMSDSSLDRSPSKGKGVVGRISIVGDLAEA
jgi:hypothetical protein